MKKLKQSATTIFAVLALLVSTAAAAGAGHDLGREVLGDNDGWAAAEGGTTGGAAATDDYVFVVDSWTEFREALGGDDARDDTTPRIVYVDGILNANTTPDGSVLTCDDYAAEVGFSMEDYIEEFADWTTEPEGPLEDLRQEAAEVQEAQIRQYIGANTTIVGLGKHSGFVGANLIIEGRESGGVISPVRNVIVRNLHISDAYDCFPQWDPTDGEMGAWNSEYDNLSVRRSTNVWVDHNTFDDGENPPESLPIVLGVKFEVHDGLLDITHSADLVTVSYNVFRDHDKSVLIGSSNSRLLDRGRLRVTLHHNRFENLGQRAPRVRFGQVHVYNNHYLVPDPDFFQYSWGVGVESAIYAENNYFDVADTDVLPRVIADWGGTDIFETGSLVNGRSVHHRVDLLAAYNAAHDPDLGSDVGWQPTLFDKIHPTQAVPALVSAHAGAGKGGH